MCSFIFCNKISSYTDPDDGKTYCDFHIPRCHESECNNKINYSLNNLCLWCNYHFCDEHIFPCEVCATKDNFCRKCTLKNTNGTFYSICPNCEEIYYIPNSAKPAKK